jgi:hypothetical protein
MRLGRVRRTLACLCMVGGIFLLPLATRAASPDFSAVVALEPEIAGPGKVTGLIRNVGSWTVRNVVLQVRHQWTWAGGRAYRHTDQPVVSRLVHSGEAAGFAAVHIPPVEIPTAARYSMDVKVLELTEIRMAAE